MSSAMTLTPEATRLLMLVALPGADGPGREVEVSDARGLVVETLGHCPALVDAALARGVVQEHMDPMPGRRRARRDRPPPERLPARVWSSLEADAGEAFWADLTRPDLGIPAVRALAPGLQPYPTDLVTPRLQREIAATGGGLGLTSGIALM